MEEQLDLGFDGGLFAVGEELGAVAALEEKGFAEGDILEGFAELDDFGGRDDGREALEFLERGGEGGGVGVGDFLLYGLGGPGGGGPGNSGG